MNINYLHVYGTLRYTFRHMILGISSRIKLIDETCWPLVVRDGVLLWVECKNLSAFNKIIRSPTSGRIGDMMWIYSSITSRSDAPARKHDRG